ncbi:MAG: NAD(P)-dependent oxidoreductase [Bacteroidetes bacterium]|nr:NAD(P)-dependent oxidoreductase [Bacteroidota bacterium]
MIAFLGTGLLGSGFVRALLKNGHQVNVWNRTPDKARALEANGATAFAHAADAVKGANRIHLCLMDDAAVDAVLEAAKAGMQPGAIIIDHTTTSVAGAVQRTEQWKQLGFTYQHAPVFMGPSNADACTGYMLISGDQQLATQLTPELSKMTGQLINLGAETGKAAGMKLVGNCFLVGFSASISDMLMLAKSVSITPAEVTGLFEQWNPGASLVPRMKRMVAADYHNPSWNLGMARKDTNLFMNEATAAGNQFTIIPAILQLMDTLITQGHVNEDWSIIAKDAVG